MHMRVDDGDGRFLGLGACRAGAKRSRPDGSRLHEIASIHFASPLRPCTRRLFGFFGPDGIFLPQPAQPIACRAFHPDAAMAITAQT
jgi:hypothetical protein